MPTDNAANRQGFYKPDDVREQEAREYERRGNAAMANGLVLQARRNYRIAEAIRSGR